MPESLLGARTLRCSHGGGRGESVALAGCLQEPGTRSQHVGVQRLRHQVPLASVPSISFHFSQTSRVVAMGTFLELEKHSEEAPSSCHWGSPCGGGAAPASAPSQGWSRAGPWPLRRGSSLENRLCSFLVVLRVAAGSVATRNPKRAVSGAGGWHACEGGVRLAGLSSSPAVGCVTSASRRNGAW